MHARACRLAGALLAAVVLATPAGAGDVICASYAPVARQVGAVPTALPELSGLAASRRHPGIYWAHNDSGNAFVLYAIRETGVPVASFPLDGPRPSDPEDIAVGPCAAGSPRTCVWLGDIGDNRERRRQVQLYRIAEPEQLVAARLRAESLPFRYPDGPHDAETLMIDPRSAVPYVVTKTLGALGDVYRVDGLGAGRVGSAVRIRHLDTAAGFGRWATGGDAHPGGQAILLRTYGDVFEFRRPGATSLEQVLATPPARVTDAVQLQGEAVTYLADGRGYLLGGEGVGSGLFRVDCAGTPAGPLGFGRDIR